MALTLTFLPGIYKKAYPDAKVIGPAGLIEKTKKDGLEFDGGTLRSLASPSVLSNRVPYA